MDLPHRKKLRLPSYDYRQNGAYFITICTEHRKNLFGNVGADSISAPTISNVIRDFKRHTTIAYIGLVKQGLAPPFEKRIWQRSFYDHVIRNDHDYREIWQYIENNPIRWNLDRYYEE